MNGIPSTSDSGGVQPGDGGNAKRPEGSDRSAIVRQVRSAFLKLQEAAQVTQDVDLSRACEKVQEWLARE